MLFFLRWFCDHTYEISHYDMTGKFDGTGGVVNVVTEKSTCSKCNSTTYQTFWNEPDAIKKFTTNFPDWEETWTPDKWYSVKDIHMKLKDLQPYDTLTTRNNRWYHHYAGSTWDTHNEDFTSKTNPKFDIVLVERDGIVIFEDEVYKKLHNQGEEK